MPKNSSENRCPPKSYLRSTLLTVSSFPWYRISEPGEHHARWLLLHALFMNARVLRTPKATVIKTINNEAFIATSLLRVPELVSDRTSAWPRGFDHARLCW